MPIISWRCPTYLEVTTSKIYYCLELDSFFVSNVLSEQNCIIRFMSRLCATEIWTILKINIIRTPNPSCVHPPPFHHVFVHQLQTSITQSFVKLEHFLRPFLKTRSHDGTSKSIEHLLNKFTIITLLQLGLDIDLLNCSDTIQLMLSTDDTNYKITTNSYYLNFFWRSKLSLK